MLRDWNTVEDIVSDYKRLTYRFNQMWSRGSFIKQKPEVQITRFGWHPILIFAPYAIGCLTGHIDPGFPPANCKEWRGCTFDRCYMQSGMSGEIKSIIKSTGSIASQLARASYASVLFPLRELVIKYPHVANPLLLTHRVSLVQKYISRLVKTCGIRLFVEMYYDQAETGITLAFSNGKTRHFSFRDMSSLASCIETYLKTFRPGHVAKQGSGYFTWFSRRFAAPAIKITLSPALSPDKQPLIYSLFLSQVSRVFAYAYKATTEDILTYNPYYNELLILNLFCTAGVTVEEHRILVRGKPHTYVIQKLNAHPKNAILSSLYQEKAQPSTQPIR